MVEDGVIQYRRLPNKHATDCLVKLELLLLLLGVLTVYFAGPPSNFSHIAADVRKNQIFLK